AAEGGRGSGMDQAYGRSDPLRPAAAVPLGEGDTADTADTVDATILPYARREATICRSAPYGSFMTLHSLSRIIVARLLISNAGQVGRALWLGLPVRAKVVQAVLILSC